MRLFFVGFSTRQHFRLWSRLLRWISKSVERGVRCNWLRRTNDVNESCRLFDVFADGSITTTTCINIYGRKPSGGARTCNGVSIDAEAVAVSLDNFGRDRVSRCIHIVAVDGSPFAYESLTRRWTNERESNARCLRVTEQKLAKLLFQARASFAFEGKFAMEKSDLEGAEGAGNKKTISKITIDQANSINGIDQSPCFLK